MPNSLGDWAMIRQDLSKFPDEKGQFHNPPLKTQSSGYFLTSGFLRRRAAKRPATRPAIPKPNINRLDGSGTGTPLLLEPLEELDDVLLPKPEDPQPELPQPELLAPELLALELLPPELLAQPDELP